MLSECRIRSGQNANLSTFDAMIEAVEKVGHVRKLALLGDSHAYGRVPPPEMNTKAKILAYGQDVLGRFRAWWGGPGQTTDFSRKAHVYYGDVTLHEYLERTTWHSGQHARHEVSLFSDAPFFNFSRIVPIRDSVRPSDNRKEFHPCVPA
jgi:hypothetical protein